MDGFTYRHRISLLFFSLTAALTLIALLPTHAHTEELSVQAAAPADTAAKSEIISIVGSALKQEKPSDSSSLNVGTHLPQMREMAESTIKNALYCIALFLLGVSLYKRFRGKNAAVSGAGIDIIAQKPMGQRSSILVVSFDEQRFMLANSNGDIQFLTEIEQPHAFTSALREAAHGSREQSKPEFTLNAAGVR